MRYSPIRMIALLTAMLAIPASAQFSINPPDAGKILLNSGQYLDIGRPHRINDTDYVDSIDYRPGTHSITVTSHNIVNDQVMSSIKLVQGDDGSKETLLSDMFDLHSLNLITSHDSGERFTPDQVKHLIEVLERNLDIGGPCLATRGWSRSGRYLFVEYREILPRRGKIISIDMQATPPAVQGITLDGDTIRDPFWSPDHTRAVFIMPSSHPEKSMVPEMIAIFDPATAQFTKKVRPDALVGWDEDIDDAIWIDNNLLTDVGDGQKNRPTTTAKLKQNSDTEVRTLFRQHHLSHNCPIHPELTSEFVDKPITASNGTPTIHVLMLRRDQGPSKLSSVVIAAGWHAQHESTPQVAWASDGKQFAYTLDGQLYVVDIIDHQATDREKAEARAIMDEYRLDLGDLLPCNELRLIASSKLRQVGLGIMQYLHDHDEKFPRAANIDKTLYPYLKDNKVYSVGKYHWVYTPPKHPSLIKMEAPAQTPIGHLDIPCAHLILYGDGHVKVK